jgi:hypothetical protein
MKKIIDIYFKRIILNEESFPYNRDQSIVQIVENDIIIIEYDNGFSLLISLSNKKIEYSIELNYISNHLISFKDEFSNKKSSSFCDFLGSNITEVKYLHSIDGIETVFNKSKALVDFSYNRIGVKFIFENENELFIYSAEPEMINENEFQVFRESSVLCIIISNKKTHLLTPKDINEFPETYEIKR